MKRPKFYPQLLLATVTLPLLLVGCATTETASEPVACKVVAMQPGKVGYDATKNTSIDAAKARADLATSQYRFAQLNRSTGQLGTIEQALRDCN